MVDRWLPGSHKMPDSEVCFRVLWVVGFLLFVALAILAAVMGGE